MADIPLHVTQSQNFVEFLRSVNDGYHAPARDALLAVCLLPACGARSRSRALPSSVVGLHVLCRVCRRSSASSRACAKRRS